MSEEAKKREILTFYKKCKIIYDEVYYEWRDVKKAYYDYVMLLKNPPRREEKPDEEVTGGDSPNHPLSS